MNESMLGAMIKLTATNYTLWRHELHIYSIAKICMAC